MRFSVLAPVGAGLLAFMLSWGQALAGPTSESAFYRFVSGKWAGPGEIVAGKFKGTKFTCAFDGSSPDRVTGLKIDGTCRVGMFSQPMNALFKRAGAGYTGQFLDGEAGEGMDVVGGRYTRSRLVVEIRRKDLRGVMVARLRDNDKLNITISVRVDSRLIPVIGMELERKDVSDGFMTSSTSK